MREKIRYSKYCRPSARPKGDRDAVQVRRQPCLRRSRQAPWLGPDSGGLRVRRHRLDRLTNALSRDLCQRSHRRPEHQSGAIRSASHQSHHPTSDGRGIGDRGAGRALRRPCSFRNRCRRQRRPYRRRQTRTGPVIFGSLVEQASYQVAWLAAAGLLVLAICCAWIARRLLTAELARRRSTVDAA